jgi:CRP-like cAMP-binding protein
MNYFWDNIFKRPKKEDEVRNALRENLLFKDLTERELNLVHGVVHVRQYHAGEPIFRQGEVGVGMYIIVSGRVEIYVTDAGEAFDEGHDIFITQLLSGDFFGEISLVEDIGRRTGSAIARDETTVIGFFKPDLLEILKRSPNSGIKILCRLAEILGRRLKETTGKVSELRRALKEISEPPPTEV